MPCRRSILLYLVPALLMFGVVVGAVVLARRGPAGSPAPVAGSAVLSGQAMGGTWSVKLPRLPVGATGDALERSLADRLAALDGMMSIYKAESDLCRFNSTETTDWVAVPREVAEVVVLALSIGRASGGAFDVTVAPVVELWGFGPNAEVSPLRQGRVPTDERVAAARAHVGYTRLHARMDPPALRKDDPALRVDLGAIAKGYAADAVARELDRAGATDYLVAVTGELRARGMSAGGRAWRVGIETPTPDVRRILETLELREQSLSTSGDYRNFFEVGGRRYAHEIDPRTGRPVEGGPASVSVIVPAGPTSSATADAWATALMVLPADEAYDLAVRTNLAALVVTRGEGAFRARATPAMERVLGR